MSFLTLFFERSYKNILKPILFRFDPELVHNHFIKIGSKLGEHRLTRLLTQLAFDFESPILEQIVAGMKFRNPIGLSAGFDKDANLVEIIPKVGFGYMEVGTVTLEPYRGNPTPRLMRLPNSKALVVNFGLKNIGVRRIIQKLSRKLRRDFKFAISVGKTNSPDTNSLQSGIRDYFGCLNELVSANVGDFYVINISCPNTFGGEPFTTKIRLEKLLAKLVKVKTEKPIFIKMPINLVWKDFDLLLKIIIKYRLAGVIIGNLNKDRSRPEIKDFIPENQKGGISGLPTQKLSDELIGKTYQKYCKKLAIIGVGGVFSPADAYRKIRLGASLVSLITGVIYEGPQLIGKINSELVEMLQKDGFGSISEAIGAEHRSI